MVAVTNYHHYIPTVEVHSIHNVDWGVTRSFLPVIFLSKRKLEEHFIWSKMHTPNGVVHKQPESSSASQHFKDRLK